MILELKLICAETLRRVSISFTICIVSSNLLTPPAANRAIVALNAFSEEETSENLLLIKALHY